MPKITITLDTRHAERLTRWARRSKASKSELIRTLIDRVGSIEAADDLLEWVESSAGKGLGLAQRNSRARFRSG